MENIYDAPGMLLSMLISFAISFLVGRILLECFVHALSPSRRVPPKPVPSYDTPSNRRP